MTVNHQLPPMAAAVIEAGSKQGQHMRFGKEKPPKPAILAPGEAFKQTLAVSTAIYDGLAVLYNQAEPGAMIVVDLPNRPTMGNLNRILKGRGLTPNEDYSAFRAKFDVDGNKYPVKDRPLVIEKVTAVEMRISAQKNGFGEIMAAQAKERGETATDLTHARKLNAETRQQELADERVAEALAESEDLLAQAAGPVPLTPRVSELDLDELERLESLELPPLEVGD